MGSEFDGLRGFSNHSETETLLAELQQAAEEHRRILERQSQLIQRLREELKDVRR